MFSSLTLAQLQYNVIKRSVQPPPMSAESAKLTSQTSSIIYNPTSVTKVARGIVTSTARTMGSAVCSGLKRVPIVSSFTPSSQEVVQVTSVPPPRTEVIFWWPQGESFHLALLKSALKLTTKLWLNILLEAIVFALKSIG